MDPLLVQFGVAKGTVVRTRHLRRVREIPPDVLAALAPLERRRGAKLAGEVRAVKAALRGPAQAHGGSTVITVLRRDGVTATGIARCCPADSYNRRLGRRIALARALAGLAEYDEYVALRDDPHRALDLAASTRYTTLRRKHDPTHPDHPDYPDLEEDD